MIGVLYSSPFLNCGKWTEPAPKEVRLGSLVWPGDRGAPFKVPVRCTAGVFGVVAHGGAQGGDCGLRAITCFPNVC